MEFEYNISLKDTWLEFRLNQWQEAKSRYQDALRTLNNLDADLSKPVATKTFTEDYHLSDCPMYKAKFWKEVADYIKEKESDSNWEYSYLAQDVVDANTDPYDDYELPCTQWKVYATISGDKPDVRETLEYKEQLGLVQMLYNELMTMKDRLEYNLEKEKQNG